MTLASPTVDFTSVQHLTLSNVSWAFYEHLLAEIGNGATRVTYLNGEVEIMSPLPKHETWGWRINQLLILLAAERDFELEGLGSTTFRDVAKQMGLEPDECYYVNNIDAVKNLDKAWDPATDPPPDLAIEIDITRRSIEREPIYAALRVRELWRFNGRRLTARALQATGDYQTRDRSEVFPFLPLDPFFGYLLRFASEPQRTVLREFREWVRTL